MQSKGAIRFVAILLLLASFWQLSFTLVTNLQEKKAAKYAEAKAVAAMETTEFSKVAEADKAFYLDSIRKDENRWYLDSISSEKIYFGYTFKDVKAKSINLGLDLKGGMNVMLQVQLKDLVKALAGNNEAPEFAQALALAQERSVESRLDYISLFAEAWKETSNGMPLAQIFGTYEMRDQIKPEHYETWTKWAKERGYGLNLDPTCFSHPLSADGFTLSHHDEKIRKFWIDHVIATRKIAEYIGKEMGEVCASNYWIPDGFKDIPVDRNGYRKRLEDSLNKIFAVEVDPKYNVAGSYPVGHTGGAYGLNSIMIWSPADGWGIVAMTNGYTSVKGKSFLKTLTNAIYNAHIKE